MSVVSFTFPQYDMFTGTLIRRMASLPKCVQVIGVNVSCRCAPILTQGHVHVRAVPRGYEHAMDQDAEGQQEELEESL